VLSLFRTCAAQHAFDRAVLTAAVTDNTGAAIVNASVILEDSYSRAIAQTTSDQTGRYSLIAQASRSYRLTISAPGFKTGLIERLQLSGSVVNLPDAVLEVGSVTDTIYVNECRPTSL